MCLGSVSAVQRFFSSCGTGSVEPGPRFATQQDATTLSWQLFHPISSLGYQRTSFKGISRHQLYQVVPGPHRGESFENLKPVYIYIGKKTVLRCRSSEGMKLWGASTTGKNVAEIPMKWHLKNPCKWPKEPMNGWIKKARNQWIDESMNEENNEAINEWTNDSLKTWLSEWMNQPSHESVNQWSTERINGSMLTMI